MSYCRSLNGSVFQEGARLLITFAMQVMKQLAICGGRKLAGQVVQLGENREQVGFGIRRGHLLHGPLQRKQSFQHALFDFIHSTQIFSLG